MVVLIISIILAVIAVIVSIALFFAFDGDYKKICWVPVAVGALIVGALMLFGSFTTVSAGHTGVLTFFGEVQDQTLDAGFSLTSPLAKKTEMDIRVQKETVGMSCFSADLQEVECEYTVNFQVSPAAALNLYRSVGPMYYENIVVPNVRESAKLVVARYTAEELIANRDQLAAGIESELAERLSAYQISLVATAIEDLDFSDAFTSAVEAKQVSAQQKLQAEIENERKIAQAQADAKVAETQAKAAAEVARIQAEAGIAVGEAEARKNEILRDTVTDELLQYYMLQKWDGCLPDTLVEGGSGVGSVFSIGGGN